MGQDDGFSTPWIVGDLDLADEAMHPVDDHPQFNESALLTAFTPQGEGGFLRIGNRPNEGHAEATFCWFLPDGSTLFSFDRAEIQDNSAFRTGRITVDTPAPGERLRAAFRGYAHHLPGARALLDPKAAFAVSPQAEVELDLEFAGVSPLYGGKPFPGLQTGGHYEQHMHGRGALTVDGRSRPVDAWGNRDHSWGPRVWQATCADRTLWCTFGRDFGIAVSLTWRSRLPDDYEVIGYVWRNETMTRVVDASISSTFDDAARLFHDRFQGWLHLEDGESLAFRGRARQVAPLRHRRDGQVTHIGWAMADFECDGRRSVGLSEYLDLGEARA